MITIVKQMILQNIAASQSNALFSPMLILSRTKYNKFTKKKTLEALKRPNNAEQHTRIPSLHVFNTSNSNPSPSNADVTAIQSTSNSSGPIGNKFSEPLLNFLIFLTSVFLNTSHQLPRNN